MRIMIISGSARSPNNCPDQAGKTEELARVAGAELRKLGVEVDPLSLAVEESGQSMVQPCKGCVSTAGGWHCTWRVDAEARGCTCYGPKSANKKVPDLMHDREVYRRLGDADGFMVVMPVYWYGPPTQVKAMFDRLVCANMTLPAEYVERLTDGDSKNATKTRELERRGTGEAHLRNWLEGRTAAFLAHGDDGADDYAGTRRRRAPPSLRAQGEGPDWLLDPTIACQAFAAQCRYSGIWVDDDLVVGRIINRRRSYGQGNDRFAQGADETESLKDTARALASKLAEACAGRRPKPTVPLTDDATNERAKRAKRAKKQ